MAKIHHLSVKKDVKETGYWDHTFLFDILFKIDVEKSDREIFIIPGAYQYDVVPKINEELSSYEKVLVFITSDEECKFPVADLKHPNMIVYSQYGNDGIPFPIGYSPKTRQTLKRLGYMPKHLLWSFMGQIVNNTRRAELARVMEDKNGYFLGTDGFSQGIDKLSYNLIHNISKFVICPPGNVAVDSFRLYEALEAGSVPLADNVSPVGQTNWWSNLFGRPKFPIFNDYTKLPEYINALNHNRYIYSSVYAWWQSYKFSLRLTLMSQLGLESDDTIVVIPVSPIPSHPSTDILEETIKSVRTHVSSPILLLFDGIREEDREFTLTYHEFIKRMLWKTNFEYEDVIPIVFTKHKHQSGMLKELLPTLPKEKYLLFVEQDTPLTPDREINWKLCKDVLRTADVIRFHFEEHVPEPHKYLMMDNGESGLMRTAQWSQRPHLSKVSYYNHILNEYFSDKTNCMIEDRMHSIVQSEPQSHEIYIYHPKGGIKRSYHLDGREGRPKHEEKFVY